MRNTLVVGFLLSGLILFAQAEPLPQGVLMQRDGVQVTEEDLDRYIRFQVPADERARALSRPGNLAKMMENLFVVRSLADQARREELDQEDILWRADLERDRLLMRALLNHRAQAVVDGADLEGIAREAYIAEPDRYKQEEQARASHILIGTEERSEEEALALARELRQRALEGENFAELAREHSDDPSARRNRGNLGWFGAGKMVPEFEAAAFSLKEPGSISEPVHTEFGYHIILLHEYQPAASPSFDEVKERIIRSRRALLAEETRSQTLTEARSAEGARVDWDRLEALEARYRQQFQGDETESD